MTAYLLTFCVWMYFWGGVMVNTLLFASSGGLRFPWYVKLWLFVMWPVLFPFLFFKGSIMALPQKRKKD